MRRNWTEEDLTADRHILPDEQELIGSKRRATRLGFAILLKFFQLEGRFASGPQEIPAEVARLLTVLHVPPGQPHTTKTPWSGRGDSGGGAMLFPRQPDVAHDAGKMLEYLYIFKKIGMCINEYLQRYLASLGKEPRPVSPAVDIRTLIKFFHQFG